MENILFSASSERSIINKIRVAGFDVMQDSQNIRCNKELMPKWLISKWQMARGRLSMFLREMVQDIALALTHSDAAFLKSAASMIENCL